MLSTSRVARKPVIIPAGVNVKQTGNELAITGPKGSLLLPLHPNVKVDIASDTINVASNIEGLYCRKGSGLRLVRSLAGTIRARIANSIIGVTAGFERKLILVGVGYKAQSKGKILNINIGFSHPVDFVVPEGITIETPTLTEIIVKGTDKHLVGHTASMIRDIRSPEPYKGKGIKYANEVIILKETKKK